MDNVFIELSIIILIAIGFAGLMRLLKQPLIIGYILTGIVVSPYFLGVFSGSENIETFGQVGVSLLLFMVGLNLNPQVIKELGKVSIITGIGQLLFTSIVGYFIGFALGFSTVVSLYLAIAMTNSSTIIILKLLSDKGDLDRLYARIAVGFLIVQDIIAIFILMFISSSGMGLSVTEMLTETLFKGIGLLFVLFIIGVYVLPALINRVAKSQEFLLLFSIGWCLLLATFLLYLNFSMEIGALLAGITLSLSPYRYEISAKLKPLRDFFIVLFFIILGYQMQLDTLSFSWIAIIVFSLFILVGNPLILMILLGILGYTKRTGFLVGLTVAQVSEFTFIMIA
ncbi:MAG: cation:proton antiporter, partial [Nanoarchaeota archaeon]